jgi:predicted unusual protein kinase regulating ubiquinone biosynthesis (AarF/ABC1/UbiB family)
VFVQPLTAERASDPTWRLTFIDFGMMGQVPAGTMKALRLTVIAAASRDGAGMIEGMREIGVLMPRADTVELERAFVKVFERFGGLGFADLQKIDPREYRAFAAEFTDIVRALPFQFPENFLLILRALSLISGMCSSLNPQFNIWSAVEPYSAKLIRSEGGNFVQAFLQDAVANLGIAAKLPKRLDSLVSRAEAGQLSIRSPELERRSRTINQTLRRLISAVLFGVLFIGGIVVIDRNETLGIWLMAVSAVPLLHALFAGVFSRRGPLP